MLRRAGWCDRVDDAATVLTDKDTGEEWISTSGTFTTAAEAHAQESINSTSTEVTDKSVYYKTKQSIESSSVKTKQYLGEIGSDGRRQMQDF